MSKSLNDINLPGFSSEKKEVEPEAKFITGVDDSSDKDEKPEPEVRLVSAEWKPGPKGFQHNEQCFLDVKVEYLKETIRARIRGKLFATYDGEEHDLNQEIEGFIASDSSIAQLNIKKLWFVHLDHYKAWLKDKNVMSQYIIKNITHSRGANEIDSPKLDMPATPYYYRGGFCLRICTDTNTIIKGATVTIKAEDNEIFSATLEDGILEISAVFASKISVKCEYEGKTVSNPIQWIAGEPPYPEQIILIPANTAE